MKELPGPTLEALGYDSLVRGVRAHDRVPRGFYVDFDLIGTRVEVHNVYFLSLSLLSRKC